MSEAAAAHDDAGRETPEGGGHSQLVILLAACGDVLFTGAVAVHVAFADAVRWALILIVGAALTFIVATVVALVTTRKRVVIVATAFIALAGMSAAVVGVAGARRYDALRREAFGDRAGVRLVEPDSARGRQMGGAMLSSITASLAAIAALPAAGYLGVRMLRAGRTP